MGNIEFAWNRHKARTNLVKHGVSFEETQIPQGARQRRKKKCIGDYDEK